MKRSLEEKAHTRTTFRILCLQCLITVVALGSFKASAYQASYQACDGTVWPTRMTAYYHNNYLAAENQTRAIALLGQAAIEQDNRRWANLHALAARNPHARNQIEALFFSPQERAMLASLNRTLDTVLPLNAVNRNNIYRPNCYPSANYNCNQQALINTLRQLQQLNAALEVYRNQLR